MNKAFLAVKKEKGFQIVSSNGLHREPSQGELAQFTEARTYQSESELLQELGLKLCIRIDQENVALVGLGPKLNQKEYSESDLQLVESIANLTLLSTDKTYLLDEMIEKKRMTEELSIARTIQQGLIPHDIPSFEAVDTALLNIPSREVGGDYVDIAQSPDGNLIFAIADVSGKGVPAALLMANLQAMLHVLLPVEISLSEAVGRINNLLFQHTPDDKFITFFLAKYYQEERRFCYVNAGHNPGYLLRKDADSIKELTTGGILLGALPTLTPYETGEMILHDGDLILLYTDGFTETFNPDGSEEFGEARLQSSLIDNRQEDAETLLKNLLSDVEAFGDPRASDDLTALAIRILK